MVGFTTLDSLLYGYVRRKWTQDSFGSVSL